MSAWLDPAELRVGLGCMRLPLDDSGLATIDAALAARITVFDTARAYELGRNEELLGRALRGRNARVVTKGGMARTGGAWVPDGRAKTLRADCEASLAALDGVAIDVFLIHAPDPRTPWSTSVRALARLLEDGLVRRVGLANVNRRQLDQAVELAPIAAVQVALSVLDDRALRGGVLERCAELGIALIAHSPLGGTRRSQSLGRRSAVADVAAARGATPAEVALAYVLSLSPSVVAIPGARRPETARSAAGAAAIELAPDERLALGEPEPRRRPTRRMDADVVLVMGIPGAGKSLVADEYVARGYVRLNRDERGGSLASIADALDEVLSAGARRVVLDNTYLSRAARSHAVDAAGRHGIAPRCIWLETPLAQAQVNVVERLLDRFGSLPAPEELVTLARSEAGLLLPTSQMRALRELEPPSLDEGFDSVEHATFVRKPAAGEAGVFVAAGAIEQAHQLCETAAPHLVFDWRPDGSAVDLAPAVELLTRRVAGPVEAEVCPHGGGPPRCWCRPPLPGLPLAFARRHGVDPARSTVIGASPAHRALAAALGARYVSVD